MFNTRKTKEIIFYLKNYTIRSKSLSNYLIWWAQTLFSTKNMNFFHKNGKEDIWKHFSRQRQNVIPKIVSFTTNNQMNTLMFCLEHNYKLLIYSGSTKSHLDPPIVYQIYFPSLFKMIHSLFPHSSNNLPTNIVNQFLLLKSPISQIVWISSTFWENWQSFDELICLYNYKIS